MANDNSRKTIAKEVEVLQGLISSMSAVGLYCQHCGRLHIHDIPYFPGGSPLEIECPSCGQHVADIFYDKRTSITLKLVCGICGEAHAYVYQKKFLPRVTLNRIYCHHDNFELGYIARKINIEAVMDSSQAAFEELHPGEDHDMVRCQHQMLEAVNLLHDIAEVGRLTCSCGCQSMLVDIHGSHLVLECSECGRVASVNTADSEAVEQLAENRKLSFRKVHRRSVQRTAKEKMREL